MQLDPSESINNMGQLRVDVLDAADLPAADRNGFSDPYCKFILNGKTVFKTQTQKKTLHPAWNEYFEVAVASRIGAKFKVECWDWDLGGGDDFLGAANIDLGGLKLFESQEVALGLDGASGTVRLKMMFKPSYVLRSSQGSATFSGTFATPGKVIGAPVKGVGRGAAMVSGGVMKGATFFGRAGRAFGRNKSSLSAGELLEDDITSTLPMPTQNGLAAAEASSPSNQDLASAPGSPRQYSANNTTPQRQPASQLRERNLDDNKSTVSTVGAASHAPEAGTATISIVSASGFEGSNIRVHILKQTSRGWRDVHKTKAVKATGGEARWDDHETFRTECGTEAQFLLQVKDVHTFGSDKELGEGTLAVGDDAAGGVRTLQCGTGKVVLRCVFSLQVQGAGGVFGSPASGGAGGGGRRSLLPGRSLRDRI